ncbi:hypothetical protein ACH42_15240 [Endozoicomonas sp. (ex Bugula neritina AB1)]|nr:hypothetical protein ACH42_15240 [Endozoicomonas sp. (ex Bugula neritina AB1)]
MSRNAHGYLKAILVCSTACLFCAYQFMLQGATAVMVPELIASLDLDLTDIGLLTSSFLYMYLLFQVPGGYVADRFSARKLLTFCSLVIALACFWFSQANSMLEACLARGLMGIATAPGIVVCLNLVARWFPERWFCAMAGLVEAFALTGGALGPLVLPRIIASSGWRDAMIWVTLLGIVLAFLSWLLVRDKPSNINQLELALQHSKEEPEEAHQPFNRRQYAWLCLFGFGLFAMISTFAGLWGIPFLDLQFPSQDTGVADTISLVFIGAGLGAPLLGAVSSWLNKIRLTMLGSLIGALIMSWLLIFCDCSLDVKALMCFMVGFCCGGYMLVFSQVKKIGQSKSQGMVLAGANGSMLLAGPVLQPVIGYILHTRQSGEHVLSMVDYQMAFIPLLLAQLLALVAIVSLLRK